MGRVIALGLLLLTLLVGGPATGDAAVGGPLPRVLAAAHPADSVVVELLRLKVPASERAAWMEAERASWQPWLEQQPGFLERRLYWDAASEEGVLLIHWASRRQWHSIPSAKVQRVQRRFDALAREATGRNDPHPFPLLFSGELVPQ